MTSTHGRHRRVTSSTPAAHEFDPPTHAPAVRADNGRAAQLAAAEAVRTAVAALGFAESRWDVDAWRTAHAAALDMVVLLSGIGPGPEVLLNSAAATLDHARRLVDTTHEPDPVGDFGAPAAPGRG